MGRCVALLLFVMVAGSVSAQSLDCVALANGARLAGPGAVVLLGEIHGTVEAPTVVASLVCQALTAGRSVTVGLEIPIAEAAAIQSFLTSPDSTVARERLLAGAFWQRDYQDGRSSAAMIHLLETLARYRAATDALRVVLIDDPSFAGGRDAHMAQAVADAIVARPDDVLVTLTGNLHNRLTRGTRFDANYAPMGYRLRRLLPSVDPISLNLAHTGGSAWVCTGGTASDCGRRDLEGSGDPTRAIEMFDGPAGPYTGRYHVGTIEASPPAVTGGR